MILNVRTGPMIAVPTTAAFGPASNATSGTAMSEKPRPEIACAAAATAVTPAMPTYVNTQGA